MAFTFGFQNLLSEKELKFTNIPVTDEPREEEEVFDHDHPAWKYLPAVPLVQIMSYLPPNDRVNMSLACRNWSQHFYDPILWRKKEFIFGGPNPHHVRNDMNQFLAYALRVGKFWRVLKIQCEHPSISVCKKFQKAMSDFQDIICARPCQLKYFTMNRLRFDRYWRVDMARELLCSNITTILRTQYRIKHFDMTDARVRPANGTKLLIALAPSLRHGNGMETMRLEDFFLPKSSVLMIAKYRNFMMSLRGLHKLHLNYSYIDEEIILALSRRCPDTLTELFIKVHRADPHDHAISPEAWRELGKCCRNVGVKFYFEIMGDWDELRRIIVRQMPLTYLEIYTGIHTLSENWELGRMFRFIGDHYGHCLVQLILNIDNGAEVLDDALLYALQKCRALHDCDLELMLSVQTVSVICTMRLENKIHSPWMLMTLCNLTQDEVAEMEAIVNQFQPSLHERGFRYEFEANEVLMA